ncbi:MAG: sigma-70 family RNA polymerase sigma factor [Myxococcales bacterium]|nr:sigma-70 family RNA polymerase sigma factor [Myxococcales bacterium]
MTAEAPAPSRARPGELDDVTLRRAQAGDEAGFRALVDRYQRPIWELCWRMVAPVGLGHRADDLTQDTFVRVYRALPEFDPRGPARLSTWIFTIATRVALNELRRVRPEPAGADDLAVLATGASPRLAHEHKQAGERIAHAVAALPSGARAVLLLRDVFELDYDAIASALAIDLGTVKSRLSRARAAVKAVLAAEGVTP